MATGLGDLLRSLDCATGLLGGTGGGGPALRDMLPVGKDCLSENGYIHFDEKISIKKTNINV